MVAVVGGSELGLGTASGQVLGGQGQLGNAAQGRAGEGVTVNAVTGNLILQRQDEMLFGRGPDAGLLRTYNSRGQFNDDNGDNWRLGFSRRVYGVAGAVNAVGSTVKRLGEDGAEVTYVYDSARGLYVSSKGSGAFDTLSYDAATQRWTWTDGNTRIRELYDGANGGRIFQIVDLDNNALNLGYNANGLIVSISTATGEQMLIDYDIGAGKTSNIIAIRSQFKDANGVLQTQTRVRYSYDSANRLNSVTVDLSPEDGSIADGNTYVTTYTYDGVSTRIASMTQTDGSVLNFSYDSEFRIQTVQDYRSPTDVRITTFSYDNSNRKTTVTDPAGQTTVLSYDANGQITAIQNPAVDGVSQITRFTYDAQGNVLTVKDPRGNVTTYGYDVNGNRILERDALGNTVTRVYGANNQLLSETTYSVATPGETGTAPSGGSQASENIAHLATITASSENVKDEQTIDKAVDGVVDGYPGDYHHEWATAGEGSGAWVDLEWSTPMLVDRVVLFDRPNLDDQILSATLVFSDGTTVPVGALNNDGSATTISFTPRLVTSVRLVINSVASTSLNIGLSELEVYGIPSQIVDPSTVNIAPQAIVTASSENTAAGQTADKAVDGVVDGYPGDYLREWASNDETSGAWLDLRWNEPMRIDRIVLHDRPNLDDRILSATLVFSDGTTVPVGALNNDGSATVINFAPRVATSVRLVINTAAPDSLNIGLAEMEVFGTPASSQLIDPKTTYFVYDNQQHLRYEVTPEGRVTAHEYNDKGQRISSRTYVEIMSVDSSALTESQLALWASAQNKSSAQRTDYDYDARGLLSKVGQYTKLDASGNGVVDGTESVTHFIYDQAGELLQQIGPRSGGVTSYTYDGLGRVLTSTNALAQNTVYVYDDAGRRTTVTLANQLATTTTYDQGGHAIATVQRDTSGVLAGTSYVYDKLGRLVQESDALGAKTFHLYDAAGRKVADIDALGGLTVYRYNANNQLIQRIRVSTPVDLTVAADPASLSLAQLWDGRLSPGTDRSEYWFYDQGGHLRRSVDAAGAVVEYEYNAAGQVTRQVRRANLLSDLQRMALATTKGELPSTYAAATVAEDAQNDRVTLYAYTDDGLLATETDADGFVTRHSYNGLGQRTETVRLAGAAANTSDLHTYYFYDGADRLIARIDAEGYLTEFRFDTAGNKIAEIRYANKPAYAAGQPLVRPAASSEDQFTQYTYDLLNRLQSSTTASGLVTTVVGRDVFGNPLQVTSGAINGEQRTETRIFDSRGRVLRELSAEGGAKLAALYAAGTPTPAAIEGIWTSYGIQYRYDAAGRRTVVTNASGKTQYFYDAAGRLTYTINALGEVVRNSYDAFGEVVSIHRFSRRLGELGAVSVWSGWASWNGGIDTALAGLEAALADNDHDTVDYRQYTTRGELAMQSTGYITGMAAPSLTRYSYNAFGELATRRTLLDLASDRYTSDSYLYNRRGLQAGEVRDSGGLNIGTTTRYDAFGRAIEITDARGQLWSNSYDKLGRVLISTDPNTIATQTTYDAFDRVVSRVDGNGATTSYVYDTANRRFTVTSPEGIVTTTVASVFGQTVSVTDGRGVRTDYEYDRDGRLTRVTSAAGTAAATSTTSAYNGQGQLIETRDASGTPTVYTYDAAGRVLTRTLDPDRAGYTGLKLTTRTLYDGQGRALWTQDASGVWTRTDYDGAGRVTRVTLDPSSIPDSANPSLLADNANALNLITLYTYDTRGNALHVTKGAGSSAPQVTQYDYDTQNRRVAEHVDPDHLNLTTTYTYDANDNIVAKTDANGAVTRYVYDAGGRRIYQVDATGAVVGTVFDADGRAIQTTAYADRIALTGLALDAGVTNIVDRLSAARADYAGNVNNQTTYTVYDKDGRARFSIDAMNFVVERQYDASGNVILTKSYDKAISTVAGMTPQQVVSALGSSAFQLRSTIYDEAGRAIFNIDAMGAVIGFVYDASGRLIKETHFSNAVNNRGAVAPQILVAAPNPAITTPYVIADAANDQVTRHYYDAAGRERYSVDAMGYVVERRYDEAGREKLRLHYAAIFAATDSTTLDQLATQVAAAITEAVESSTYDKAGRLLTTGVSASVGENPLSSTRHFYDAAGRETDTILNASSGAPSQLHFEYDSAGRLIAQTQAYGTPYAMTTRYTLDGVGNRVVVTDAVGNSGYFYFDGDNRVTLQVDPEGYATRTVYNVFGAVEKIVHYANKASFGENHLVAPSLVEDIQRDQITLIEHDRNNRQTKITDAEGYFETLTYDAFGNKSAYVTKLGAVYNYTYDRQNRVLSEQWPGSYYAQFYTYDLFGNQLRSRIQDAFNSPPPKTYLYDRLNRQVQKSIGSSKETRTYDARGNMVQVTVLKDASTSLRTLYYYDAAGRKIAQLDPVSATTGALTVWQYDGRSKPVAELKYADILTLPALGGAMPTGNPTGLRVKLFTYDGNDRLLTTTVPSVAIAEVVGNAVVQYGTLDVVTKNIYDANGNVVQVVDARGNSSFNYYDKMGRRILSVDAEKYAVYWEYDGNGNVIKEIRFARKLSLNPGLDSKPATLMAALFANTAADDRTTEYSYDRMSRLFQKRVLNVQSGNVDVSGNYSTSANGTSVTSYVYNGLGLVVRQTDAQGAVTDYIYDGIGRKISELKPEYIDYRGVLVRPRTDFEYNESNQVVHQIDRDADDGSTSGDHNTWYQYGGEWLTAIDSDRLFGSGAAVNYGFDLLGNITKKREGRGRFQTDITTLFQYDGAGREIWRKDVLTGEIRETRYNAFGEITGKRVSTSGSGAWQEVADYDNAGRVWRSTSGDGTTKIYAYDANGNKTLTIQAATKDSIDPNAPTDPNATFAPDFSNLTLDQVMELNVAQKYLILSQYDKRNQLTDTWQPDMTGGHNTTTIRQFVTQQMGQDFEGGGASVGLGGQLPAGLQITDAGGAGVTTGSIQSSVYFGVDMHNDYADQTVITVEINYIPSLSALGAGDVRVDVQFGHDTNGAVYDWTQPIPGKTSKTIRDWERSTFFSGAVVENYKYGNNYNRCMITVSKWINGQLVPVARYVQAVPITSNTKNEWLASTVQYQRLSSLVFTGQPVTANRLYLEYRPYNSNQGWSLAGTYNIKDINGSDVAGAYGIAAGLPGGNYEYRFTTMDANSNVLDAGSGYFGVDPAAGPVWISAPTKQYYGGAGHVYMDTGNYLQFMEQGADVTQWTIRYRPKNSQGTWIDGSALVLKAMNGWYRFDATALTGDYEYEIKRVINGVEKTSVGKFSARNPNSVTALTAWEDLAEIVHFTGQPVAPSISTSMELWYRVAGTQQWILGTTTKVGSGAFDWDATGLVDYYSNALYEYKYRTFDQYGLVVNQATGTLQLGADPKITSHNNYGRADTTVLFNPPQTDAAQLVLYYQGSNGQVTVGPLNRVNGVFLWDVTELGSVTLDYTYEMRDANGQVLRNAEGQPIKVAGTLVVGSTSAPTNLQWQITGFADETATIHRSQNYNAFGEVAQEIDGRGNATDLAYNTMGRLVQRKQAAVAITQTDGTVLSKEFVQQNNLRPTTTYTYDLAGRLVAVRDPNGNLNKLYLLAGSGGDDGSAAVTATEFHADGGKTVMGFDEFGNVRRIAEQVDAFNWRITQQEFDKFNRLIKVIRPARFTGTVGYLANATVDTYEYDTRGNRTKHSVSLDGGVTVAYSEETAYDSLGRVTGTKSFGGLITIYSYTYEASILGVGGVAVGGYKKTTTLADNHTQIDRIDYFGHLVEHKDLGGHVFTYTYNNAGWLVSQRSDTAISAANSGQNIVYRYYANGYLRQIEDLVTGALTEYQYDREGNRIFEGYSRRTSGSTTPTFYQQSTITYDELNRVIDVLDLKAHITYQYDAIGNRMRVLSYYHDGADGHPVYQDYWYAYDSMNRFKVTQGQLSTSLQKVVGGATGIEIAYDLLGQRVSAIYRDNTDSNDPPHREDYTYTADGYLEDTYINANPDAGVGVLRTRRTNDALGRVTTYETRNSAGAVTLTRVTEYTADNLLIRQKEWDGVISNPAAPARLTEYGYGGSYANPVQTVAFTDYAKNATSTTTYYTYEWWDEAKQKAITLQAYNPQVTNYWAPGFSRFSYDVNGHLLRVDDPVTDSVTHLPTPGKGRSIEYVTDAQGLIIMRDELGGGTANAVTGIVSSGVGSKWHMFYYINGHQIGDVGNDGPLKVSYAEELAQLASMAAQKPGNNDDKYKNWKPISSANFDQNYLPINGSYPAMTPSVYTVVTGDTLQSIASAVWGDSAMWYMLADANGLTGSETLVAGQALKIPNKVTNIHNNSTTYKVYDAGEAIGDVNPTLPAAPPPPQPKKKKGCGIVGQILVIVVAAVVTYFTAGALSGALGPMVAGAIGGAAGSVASQGVAMAMGMQDGFSWSSVATAAIAGGVTGGITELTTAGGMLSSLGGETFGATVGRAVLGNVVTQGVAVATGLQEKFSWTQVAASAAGASADFGLGKLGLGTNSTDYFGRVARGTLSGAVNGGVQSAMTGQAPNWGAIAASSFGNALGNTLGESLVRLDRERVAEKTLDKMGYNAQDNRISAGVVSDLAQSGLSQKEIIDLFENNPDLREGLLGQDAGRRGRTDAEVEQVNENYLKSLSPETTTRPEIPSVVVEARDESGLPKADEVFRDTLVGGIKLANSLADLSEYGWAGQLAMKSVAAVLGGGPVKGLVTSIARQAMGQAADQAINYASDAVGAAVGGFVTKWADDKRISASASFGGFNVELGPEFMGFLAGQLTSSAVSILASGGMDAAVLRAQNVRDKVVANKGWRAGDDVYVATAKGNDPAWSTVRSRFWKNEADTPNAAEKYGTENIERMASGRAPQRYNADKGGMESMDLSHEPIPIRDGGKDFVPRWPQDHAAVDPYRKPGY